MSTRAWFAVFATLLGTATPSSAQISEDARQTSDSRIAAVNVALGALTAGTLSAARHKSFWKGFARGGAGGAVVYAGKRLIGEGNPSSWWAGRQLAALGSSEVASAAEGLPFLQRIVIPVGPVRLHVDRLAKRKVTPKLDLSSAIATVIIASRDRTRLAINESLATGAIVFVVPETSGTVGTHTAGVVSLSELVPDGKFPPLPTKRGVISHELIHAVQYDFVFTAWSDVMQHAIGKRFPAVGLVNRYVDVNLTLPLQLGVNSLIDYHDRPWETEALSIAKQ